MYFYDQADKYDNRRSFRYRRSSNRCETTEIIGTSCPRLERVGRAHQYARGSSGRMPPSPEPFIRAAQSKTNCLNQSLLFGKMERADPFSVKNRRVARFLSRLYE